MRLLLLLALLIGGAWFVPQFSEQVAAPCPAMELRTVAVLDAEVARLPPAMANDPRLPRARAQLAALLGVTRGGMAEAAVRERFPYLPPGAGCVVGWWKLTLDPDIGVALRGLLR